MNKNLLIIITGFPCTGKTTLAKKISKELHLPLISRDLIKESLFDSLGVKDREWSKKLGLASYKILYSLVESFLGVGQSLIVESNFNPNFDSLQFSALQKKHDFLAFQILCKADGKVLCERFKDRSISPERHPGHVDHLNEDEFKTLFLKGRQEALTVTGEIYELDTSFYDTIDYPNIINAINLIIRSHE